MMNLRRSVIHERRVRRLDFICFVIGCGRRVNIALTGCISLLFSKSMGVDNFHV